ncbi:MAG: hypothetical protein NVS2B14_17050 [Chamaesiphon sp.]
MAFTQEQFDALIGRLEDFARQQPATYKLRVRLLALLGYVYIFSIIGVSSGKTGLLGAEGGAILPRTTFLCHRNCATW